LLGREELVRRQRTRGPSARRGERVFEEWRGEEKKKVLDLRRREKKIRPLHPCAIRRGIRKEAVSCPISQKDVRGQKNRSATDPWPTRPVKEE